MQEIELKKLWQISNEQLERNLKISQQNAKDVKQLKLQHFLSSMKPLKIFTVIVALIWVGIGVPLLATIFMYSFEEANKFFLFSATIQVLITLIALMVYIYQLVTLYNINISGAVLKTQKDLATLKSSTLWVTRILLLQLPVWTTFYWNESMFEKGNGFLWFFQVIVTLLFTSVAFWLFFNIKYSNKDKKWFRLIFNGKEWPPLMESMELLNEVEKFKNEKDNR